MDKLELQLTPTEDLIQELLSRYEVAIFYAAQPSTTEGDKGSFTKHQKGMPFALLGLVTYAYSTLNAKIMEVLNNGQQL